MTSTLWELERVSLGRGEQSRLRDCSLTIPAGVTAVLGESGAGKTSLLNLLVGFERPDSGTVRPARTGVLGWVPPDQGLWPRSTVRRHLEAVSLPEDTSRIDDWLDAFDLKGVARRYPATLSMGERSRLAVARSLASGALIHVMDEPLSNVDSSRLGGYWNVIREHLSDIGGSLVMATHDPEVALREATHAVCLDLGTVVWQGVLRELYDRPPNERAARFLGPLNWFQKGTAPEWFGMSEPGTISVRPERLQVIADESGVAVVERTRFSGSLEEVDLRHFESGITRTVYHRPSIPILRAGMSVSLRIIACLLLMCGSFLVSGCRESSGREPDLGVITSRHYQLPPEGVMLPAPRGMTFGPQEELFVLDNAGRIIVYDKEGNLLRQWWMPEYSVGKPEGAWVLLDGRIAVADTHYHRVLFFSQTGDVLGSIGEQGEGPGQFIYTVSVTQDPHGFLYVAEYGGNDRIQKFTADGEFVLAFGKAGTDPGEFQRACGVVWHRGLVYVADAINSRVQAFRDTGEFVGVVADAQTVGLHYPYDLSLGPDESLYIAEYGAGRVTKVSLTGKLLGRYGEQGRGLGKLYTPWGIAVSRSGKVAVADTGNRRVVELQL